MLTHHSSAIKVILGTGGTIAGRASEAGDNVGYAAGQLTAQELVDAVPALASVSLEVEQVAQLDSKDMGFAVWRRLAQRVAYHLSRADVSGVVVTHGTDTLEETAYFLQEVLLPGKPVVLTCAMRPATALVPDGPQNLLDAVAVAGQANAGGVVVVCAGLVHAAEQVAKVHTYRLDAFDSGDAGPLGCVEQGQVRWLRGELAIANRAPMDVPAFDEQRLQRLLAVDNWPRVEWITSHADADGGLLRASIAQPQHLPQGIVVAGTGNGTLHQDLEATLRRAQDLGVRVVRTSRCARGQVVPGGPTSTAALPLSPAKARIALALQLVGL